MDSRRTPSGDGRGRSRSTGGRDGSTRGGSQGGFRAGRGGGFRSQAPRSDRYGDRERRNDDDRGGSFRAGDRQPGRGGERDDSRGFSRDRGPAGAGRGERDSFRAGRFGRSAGDRDRDRDVRDRDSRESRDFRDRDRDFRDRDRDRGSRDRDFGRRDARDRDSRDRDGRDREPRDVRRDDRERDGRPSGSRGRYGRPEGERRDRRERRDDVQTIGRTGGGERGGSRGRFGKDSSRRELREGGRPDFRAKPAAGRPGGRGAAAGENPFKSARQPLRDPDFYEAGYTDERDTTEVPGGDRLQKVLAQAGVASRRACEEMIGDGRVTVDGQVVRRFGARVDPSKQVIHVDGKRIPTASDLVYFALNKPIGVVSTMEDPEGRPCLQDFVQDLAPRLFHVGRLDTETEGLLLFTNDGELAHRLTHPSYGVKKKYWAKVPGPIPRDLHRVLRKGIELEDGLAKVDEFHIVQEHAQQALVEVVLHEGRKHIVRRLLEETGHRVIDLARIEFGPVKLGRLKPGTVRALTLQEVGDLYAAVGL
ncbi:pseudouridine synthase [Microtetraspora malaysiensis]|uniref:pseudouridine synthase n=1 Tax=Microtetraspora malaysiensis TaxID=161358 RepID=UPI003D93090E